MSHKIDVENFERGATYEFCDTFAASYGKKSNKKLQAIVELNLWTGEHSHCFRVTDHGEIKETDNFFKAVEWYNEAI